MSMFEIYSKVATIETPKGSLSLNIRPLSGRFLPKLYSALGKLDFSQDETIPTAQRMKEFLKSLDEDAVTKLHEICFETLKASYPSEPKEELDLFVSQNLLQLFPIVLEINLGQVKE